MKTSVRDVRILKPMGPWKTKSNGQLFVLSALSFQELQNFLYYPEEELAKIASDIRGLRHYCIQNLPFHSVGGGEFHLIRQEIIFTLNGKLKWTLEDTAGEKININCQQNDGIWLKPKIIHQYEVLEESSSIMVLANTLFNPEDSRTHDTYGKEDFRCLQ